MFLAAFVSAVLLSPRVHAAARRSSTTGFYFVAALVTGLLALGPTITLMKVPSGKDGPFMWLLTIPGVRNLRVPARFWLMTILCLAIVTGLFVARILKGRSRGVRAAVTTVVALATGGSTESEWHPRRSR